MQFNHTTPPNTIWYGDESVKSFHGRRGHRLGKIVNFETRMELLRGGNVDYGRYPAVSLRMAVVGRIEHRLHLRHIYVNRYWPTRTL